MKTWKIEGESVLFDTAHSADADNICKTDCKRLIWEFFQV